MASTGQNDFSRMLRSRRSLVILGLVVLVGFFYFGHQWTPMPARTAPSWSDKGVTTADPKKDDSASGAGAGAVSTARWRFDASKDRNNHSLTHEQCSVAFPDMYKEIDRSAQFWKARLGGKNIGPENIDLKWSGDGGLSGMIYNQQLYITHSRGLNHFLHWKERSHATLHQIQRAIMAAPEPIPNIEFSIKINDVIDLCRDCPETTIWAFSRNISDPVMEQVWVIPDFNFWSYPRVAGSFGDFQVQALEIEDDNFNAKKDLLVWRGTTAFKPELREPLIWQTENQPWSDVRRLDEDTSDADQARFRITMPDHCRYKYAVHTEGTTWSGRLKYLLSCHSAIFIHPLTWYTHLYHLLVPSGAEQNFVDVQMDWSDLPEKMNELLANPVKAKLIADNAAANFRDRYFTPAAQTCYWRRLFQTWREASYEPDPWNNTRLADGTLHKAIRGMTYEEYVFFDKSVPLEPGQF